MEHVLRVHAELAGQPEGFGLVLGVLRELGAQADQAAVQPPHDVGHLVKEEHKRKKKKM